MTRVLSLAPLIERLRMRGLEIGVREMRRLDAVFDLEPPGDSATLRQILLAALAKTEDERNLVEREFLAWLDDAGAAWNAWITAPDPDSAAPGPAPGPLFAPSASADQPLPRPRPRRGEWRRRTPWLLATAALVALVALSLAPTKAPAKPAEPAPSVEDTPRPAPRVPEPISAEPDKPVTLPIWHYVWPWVDEWSAEIRFVPRTPSATTLALLGGLITLGLGALMLCLRRRALRVVFQSRADRAAPPAPLLLPCRGRPSLVPRAARRSLVWNVEHFVSEEWTERLDLRRTVDEAAKAGTLVDLYREPARCPKEVWLWREWNPRAPRVEQVSSEIADDLRRHGLPVRTGTFLQTPVEVTWDDHGEVFRPEVLEGARDSVILGILSSGEGFATVEQHASRRRESAPTWASLALWPRVVVGIDGEISADVVAAPNRHRISWCPLRDLAVRLSNSGRGATVSQTRVAPGLDNELLAWAAALALPGRRVRDEEALALRQAMKVRVDPWRFTEIKSHAGVRQHGGLLVFHPKLYAELLNWLATTARFDHGFPEDSWPGRALTFWRSRLDDVAKEDNNRSEFSVSALDRDGLELETALLNLWDNPKAAAERLQSLSERGFLAALTGRLSRYYASDQQRPDHPPASSTYDPSDFDSPPIVLPWRWSDDQWSNLDEETREILGRLGFAKGSLDASFKVVWPRISAWVLGLGAGICLSLWAWSAWQAWRAVNIEHTGIADGIFHQTGFDEVDGRKRVWVRTRFHEFDAALKEGADFSVQWSSRRAPSVVWYGETVALRRGIRRDPIRLASRGGPRQLIAALVYDSTDAMVQQLGSRLLDAGSVDLVFIGPEPMAAVKEWLSEEGHLRPEDAVAVIGKSDSIVSAGLVAARSGPTAHAQRYSLPSPNLDRVLKDADGSAIGEAGPRKTSFLFSDPISAPETTRSSLALAVSGASLIDLPLIPAGRLLMGSPESEQDRDDDEDPQHEVKLSAFRIGRTEVTRAQYAAVRNWKDAWGPPGTDSHLPATDVTWFDAVRFCNGLSKREGLEPAYDGEETDSPTLVHNRSGYRLPSEAQWEYACRAGTTTRFWSGDSEADLARVGWYGANAPSAPRSVASKPANTFGLHDMHGNVREWCGDWWDGKYTPSKEEDPAGPANGSVRVMRGGSFRNEAGWCRSADRFWRYPGYGNDYVGFRVVLPVPPERD